MNIADITIASFAADDRRVTVSMFRQRSSAV